MLESVKIIHSWNQIKEYRFLADYFRLLGVHVCDCTLKSERLSPDFDAVIILKNSIDNDSLEILEEHYPNAIEIEASNEEIEADFNANYLKDILKVINEKVRSLSDVEVEIMKQIAEIYSEYNLSYHRNAYNYFYNNQTIVRHAQDAFIDAYIEVNKSVANKKETVHWFYSAAYLSRCINETCVFLDQSFLLSISNAMDFLDQALKLEPTFNNAYLLKGMIAELDSNLKKDAEAYYSIALEQMYGKRYASYPYYIVGRYYEKVKKKREKAVELYTRSLNLNNFEYRAIYKLAMLERKKEKYTSALERFKMICNILSDKQAENYLQPREYEYLFKAYLEMGTIYGDYLFDIEHYKESVRKRDELCDMVRDITKQNRAYDEIFKESARKFRKETYDRFFTIVVRCTQ
mgnify:CR=1 FL=1